MLFLYAISILSPVPEMDWHKDSCGLSITALDERGGDLITDLTGRIQMRGRRTKPF